MHANADLHIHSRFSMASSRGMTPGGLIAACRRKGIQVLGSGDALHPGWQEMWLKTPHDTSGVLVVPTAEVEDRDRVHHLIMAEDFSRFTELRDRFMPFSSGIAKNGRPRVNLPGSLIAETVHEIGGAIGPAHAFTPWTSLYASFDSLAECYGSEPVDFLELGLSADSSYGAPIPELYRIPFLSNSDAHSADPAKCGREFTCIDIGEWSPRAVIDSVTTGKIVMNAGFFPEEGKYNRTACSRCYEQYTLEEAVSSGWKCPKDGGRIKKGVADRARELSGGNPSSERPPYLHIIPLAEIIRKVLGVASPDTRKTRSLYDLLLESFGDEITVLTRIRPERIGEIHEGVAHAIGSFRDGRVRLFPGGGGRYGSFEIL